MLQNGKRCVIFGSSGFIGDALFQRLLAMGVDAAGFDLCEPGERVPGGRFLRGDFADPTAVSRAVAGAHYVVHLVSTTTPGSSNDDIAADIRQNLIATVGLLQACVSASVEKVIFVSSGGTIYGPGANIPSRENDPLNPICSYAIGKLAIEKYLYMYKVLHNLDYCVLRIGNPYGPGQFGKPNFGVVAHIMRALTENSVMEIWGDGSTVRDFVYIDDVVSAFVAALNYSGDTPVFNIGSGEGVAIRQLIEIVAGATGREVKVHCDEQKQRLVDLPYSVLDVSLANTELGWTPKTCLSDGIKAYYEWMREAGSS